MMEKYKGDFSSVDRGCMSGVKVSCGRLEQKTVREGKKGDGAARDVAIYSN